MTHDLANETACPCHTCTVPNTPTHDTPGEALEVLRAKWAAEDVRAAERRTELRTQTYSPVAWEAGRTQPRAAQGHQGADGARVNATDVTTSRRNWRLWDRLGGSL